LPVFLYRFETLSLTLTEDHRLNVFENRVLRIFGPKFKKTAFNEELQNLYSSPNIIII
jgi:hypothetical protein